MGPSRYGRCNVANLLIQLVNTNTPTTVRGTLLAIDGVPFRPDKMEDVAVLRTRIEILERNMALILSMLDFKGEDDVTGSTRSVGNTA